MRVARGDAGGPAAPHLARGHDGDEREAAIAPPPYRSHPLHQAGVGTAIPNGDQSFRSQRGDGLEHGEQRPRAHLVPGRDAAAQHDDRVGVAVDRLDQRPQLGVAFEGGLPGRDDVRLGARRSQRLPLADRRVLRGGRDRGAQQPGGECPHPFTCLAKWAMVRSQASLALFSS
jgi:hypothetical protein